MAAPTAFAASAPLPAPAHARAARAACQPRAPRAPAAAGAAGARMGPWKPGEKDDAFAQQQEILARRRDAKRSGEYFEGVERRRAELEAYRDERVLKVRDGEDPLIPWKVMKDKGLIEEAGYPDEAEGGSASGGIPLPMASFGIPSKCARAARRGARERRGAEEELSDLSVFFFPLRFRLWVKRV